MTQDWNTLAALWGSRTLHLQTGTFLAPDTPHCRISLESWWALRKTQGSHKRTGTVTRMTHDVSRRWMLLPDAFLAHLQQPKCQSWSCSAPLSESSCREHRKSYCCSCCIDLCRIQNHRDAGSDRFLTAVCSAEGLSPSLPSSILTSPDSSGTMKCPTQSVGVSEFWCTGKHLIVRSHLQTSR